MMHCLPLHPHHNLLSTLHILPPNILYSLFSSCHLLPISNSQRQKSCLHLLPLYYPHMLLHFPHNLPSTFHLFPFLIPHILHLHTPPSVSPPPSIPSQPKIHRNSSLYISLKRTLKEVVSMTSLFCTELCFLFLKVGCLETKFNHFKEKNTTYTVSFNIKVEHIDAKMQSDEIMFKVCIE